VGLKERLLSEILTTGIERCQRDLDVAAIQKQYNAYERRVVRLQVMDVSVPPTFLVVRDGHIDHLPASEKWDCEMRFVYLDTFLDVLMGKYLIEQIFSFNGFRPVRKSTVPFRSFFGIRDRWERVVYYKGDIGRDSFFLREVMRQYIGVLRKILLQMPTMRYIVGPAARAKRMFGRGDRKFDITASAGDGFSTSHGDKVERQVSKQEGSTTTD